MSDEAIELALETEDGRVVARLSLPVRVEVNGQEAVLVSAEAYAALSQAASKSAGKLSRIERDPELRRFVDDRLATLDLSTLVSKAAQRFGQERAPSRTALHRYAMSRRKAAGAVTRPTERRRDPRRPV